MKPGEEIEIRTPNAVAGIRGTVVITEVSQATSQLGQAATAFTTTITVLTGAIEVRQLDALTRQPMGAGMMVGASQAIRLTGAAPPRPVTTITPDTRQRLTDEFKLSLKDAPAPPSADHYQQQTNALSSPSLTSGKATTSSGSGSTTGSSTTNSSASTSGSGGTGSGSGSSTSSSTTPTTTSPTVSTPSTTSPTVSTPTVSTPTVTTPTVTVPTVTAPVATTTPPSATSSAASTTASTDATTTKSSISAETLLQRELKALKSKRK